MLRVAALVALSIGCTPSVPSNLSTKLTEQGSCADLFVYAANRSDTLVLSISIDEGLVEAAHAAQETVVTTIGLPDASATVMLTDGTRVSEPLCNDVVDNPVAPKAEWSATAGTLEIAITPGGTVDEARANVEAKGLVFDGAEPFDFSWFDKMVGWLPG